jgi:hypothetical protein
MSSIKKGYDALSLYLRFGFIIQCRYRIDKVPCRDTFAYFIQNAKTPASRPPPPVIGEKRARQPEGTPRVNRRDRNRSNHYPSAAGPSSVRTSNSNIQSPDLLTTLVEDQHRPSNCDTEPGKVSETHSRMRIQDLAAKYDEPLRSGHRDATTVNTIRQRTQRAEETNTSRDPGWQSASPEISTPADTSSGFRSRNADPTETLRRSEPPTSSDADSIPNLEAQIQKLRGYAADLLELSMEDSHRSVMEHLSALEERIAQKRRIKSQQLLMNLEQDFPALAAVAKGEAKRRGL